MKIQDPAAMHYDPKTGLLNVVNDADNIFVEFTLAGKMVKDTPSSGMTRKVLQGIMMAFCTSPRIHEELSELKT